MKHRIRHVTLRRRDACAPISEVLQLPLDIRKTITVLFLCVLALFAAGTESPAARAVPGAVSLDKALFGAAADLNSKVQDKTEIAIAGIQAMELGSHVSDFLEHELSAHLVKGGKFTMMERSAALDAVTSEHQFQRSGLVSDDSIVSMGHYLGAKVVLTGTFSRFAGFSQIRLRAIDVKSSQVLTVYSARVRPDDKVLASVMGTRKMPPAPTITEDALAYLNRGEDFIRGGRLDDAVRELDGALAINGKLPTAYFSRGYVYYKKGDTDRAIADYTAALRIKLDYADALYNRGLAYANKGDIDHAIADYTDALKIKPDDAGALNNRGVAYRNKGDNDRAIADYTAALKIKPDNANALLNRGYVYYKKGDINRAIADYTDALKIKPDDASALLNRGNAYYRKGDIDRAIADYNAALKIKPDLVEALNNRGSAYQNKGDNDRAIADWEAVLLINPNHTITRNNLERARKK